MATEISTVLSKKAKDQSRYDVFIQESILFSKKGKDLFLHGEKNLKMR